MLFAKVTFILNIESRKMGIQKFKLKMFRFQLVYI